MGVLTADLASSFESFGRALDRFIDAWGEHQNWLLFDTRQIDEIQQAKPFDVKLLDVQVPESFRAGPAQGVGA